MKKFNLNAVLLMDTDQVFKEEEIANTSKVWRPKDSIDVRFPAGFIPKFYAYNAFLEKGWEEKLSKYINEAVYLNEDDWVLVEAYSGWFLCMRYSKNNSISLDARQLDRCWHATNWSGWME